MDSIPTPDEVLEWVIPFQFLSRARRAALAPLLVLGRHPAGAVVLREGEASRDLYLLAAGVVEAVDESHVPPRVLSTIEAGHYFGERAALFEAPRAVTIRAVEPVATYTLPADAFLALVDEVPAFAQALANSLKVKQGIFVDYQRLYARLLNLIERRELLLSELLDAYVALAPALHPYLLEERIDVAALHYAVTRLPEGVTRTSYYYLTDNLPVLYRDPESKFEALRTENRRRAAWRPLPGKAIIFLRDGISDVTDVLTCLCLYALEARKLRRRLRSSWALHELRALSERPDPPRERAFLERLALSDDERAGLQRVWPERLAERLRDVLLHHEDIALEVDTCVDNYNSRASEAWVTQIRARARELVDLEDPALEVHLVSSNTHSVANCLSAFVGRRCDEILAWGRAHRPDLAGEPSPERPWGRDWANPRDLVYATTKHYLARVPGARERWRAEEQDGGHHRLSTTAFTGIEVDLLDVRRLDPAWIDPAVSSSGLAARLRDRPRLIVNVDYAFGQQAEEILYNLLYVFGHRVRSVNVLGKAGGLVGRRGDVLLPGATLLQTNDELYPLRNLDLPADMVRALASGRDVHEGPVLTVAGTLLQDRTLLHFYRRIWKCVGLEMEGSFFARQLASAVQTGVVRGDVRSRFAYYVSDLPLRPDENLSDPMKPWEGVPPLYAITRAMLSRILAE